MSSRREGTAGPEFPAGVYIGRFQPPHDAHLAVMREALERVRSLIVVIGSTHSARTTKNPFTAGERQEMITGALQGAGIPASRVRFVWVRDFPYDEERWLAAVRAGVERAGGETGGTALAGHVKDDSSYYLRSFPEWPYLPTHVQSPLSATQVREAYFRGEAVRSVPTAVTAFLGAFERSAEYAALRAEFAFLAGRRRAGAWMPQPPVQVETGVLVMAAGQALLVRRDERPGRGLLALPGGEVRAGLPLLASGLVSLAGQTGLNLDPGAWRSSSVFDHPGRSELGRVIMHAHHFVLDAPFEPAGLAPRAAWYPVQQLLAQPEAFFEDHHAILEHFLTHS